MMQNLQFLLYCVPVSVANLSSLHSICTEYYADNYIMVQTTQKSVQHQPRHIMLLYRAPYYLVGVGYEDLLEGSQGQDGVPLLCGGWLQGGPAWWQQGAGWS